MYLNIIKNTINTRPYILDIASIANISIADAGRSMHNLVFNVIERLVTKLSRCFL